MSAEATDRLLARVMDAIDSEVMRLIEEAK